MLNQPNSRVPFTIFEFLMAADLVASKQSPIGLLEYYMELANNYIQDRLTTSLEKYVGERIIVSHLLSLTIQYPELTKDYEKQIWDRLSVKNIQAICYFECFTRFSLCVSPSNETVPLWDAFSSWLLTWLTNDSPNVVPHVLPICLLLDSLANEPYVVNDDNIDPTVLNYLNNVIRTRCTYIIQQMTNMIDECVMDFHFNSESESYLNALIKNHFLSQSSTTQSSNGTESSEHLTITPHNFFDLNQVLTMLSYRWGTECEHFWLVMLKCIGLATKQNAVKTIVELLLIMDFSSMPLDDERIVNRINLARELITTLELKWKDVVSLAINEIMEKTLLYKDLDLPSLAINTQHTGVYKTLVYFIITNTETSNVNLTDLISGLLVTNKTCKCIIDALGKSYRKLLRNFRSMLNSHNDRIETTNSGWLLLLLLYITSHMLKKSSARYIIACCNELMDVWFDVISRQSQLTNTNGRKVQWDKTIAVLEMIVLTFSQYQEAFLYIPNLVLKKFFINNEPIRNWPCKMQTTTEVTSDSESYIRHKIPRFRFGAPNSNSKSSITAWKTLKPKPWSVKKPSSSINSNSWQKNFVMFINNSNTSSPDHDCSISNAWNNGILFRICCMRPDLLSFESSKTSLLTRLLLLHLTTKEPPTNITGHIILPKSITYRRDAFLQSTFSEHPELWILLNFLANDYVMFEELFNSIVRSLFAMNITSWYRIREPTRRNNQVELDTAIRLVEILQKVNRVFGYFINLFIKYFNIVL
ncbi:integrator complex subunit 5-like [Gigaspora margarita]|uniref:Integrator complex subunit 5-like n=1 Tax=Gigaspora margarita TaxID=4874 RepID=A0A8H3X8L5_GIGMA|nr:integrator complex subunit 5-like [Gigaspora margarita]